MLKVGCCGFGGAQRAYFDRFPVIEVQHTFYQPPRPATLERWRAQAPAAFEFTLKAWQVITHTASSPTYRRMRHPPGPTEAVGYFRPSETVLAAWERTRAAARALQARLVLFQCPASFTPSAEHLADLRAFFAQAARGGLTFVWEPRGPAWSDELVGALCAELDLVHGVDPFRRQPVRAQPAYFRLHGITGARHRFSDQDLARLRAWCAEHSEVYCLFNNLGMVEDALRFQALVGQETAGRDPIRARSRTPARRPGARRRRDRA